LSGMDIVSAGWIHWRHGIGAVASYIISNCWLSKNIHP